MNMTSKAGFSSKSWSVHVFPVKGSGSSKAGAGDPRAMVCDSMAMVHKSRAAREEDVDGMATTCQNF